MNLFKPDFFSIPKPVWNECHIDRYNFIDNLFSENYGNALGSVLNVTQVGGIEINSNNYCIETFRGKYLLKKWGGRLSRDQVLSLCGLLSMLNENQVPFPLLITANNRSPIVDFSDNIWSLFYFNDGDFYSGNLDQLHSIAISTGVLFNKLSLIDSQGKWLQAPEIRSEQDAIFFKKIFDNKNQTLAKFSEAEKNVLELYWDVLKDEVARVFNADLYCGSFQLSHFDLHPHNILMQGDELSSFLDIDSVRLMNVGYAIGFASLKLCRQAVVFSQKDPRKVADMWTSAMTSQFEPEKRIFLDLGDLAIAEVLRRIAIILRLNVEENNRDWNSFLHVQLGHLKEARILFNN